MNIYKLTTSPFELSRELNRINFEIETQRRTPYYQINRSGDPACYAVCPACNGPIELIGMVERRYEINKNDLLYARHYPFSVDGLASYNQQDYEECDLRARKSHGRNARKKSITPVVSEFLTILKKQFDRCVYVLSKNTGIKFSRNLLEAMLQRFWLNQGYLYKGANLQNIPWIFGYLSDSHPLYGQLLDKRSPITAKIITKLQKNPSVKLTEEKYGFRILAREHQFIRLSFCFHSHKFMQDDNGNTKETLIFSISEPMDEFDFNNPHSPLNNILFEEKIVFDHNYFINLISPARDNLNRNAVQLGVAEQILP